MKRRVFEVAKAESGHTLAELLVRHLEVSADAAKALVAQGAVYRQGRRVVDSAGKAHPSEKILVVLEESGQSTLEPLAAAGAPKVLFEDEAVLALDKPAGLTSQPTPGRVGASAADWATRHLGRKAGLVHRLDRETSGVLIFGKSVEATRALAAAFREGRVGKVYLAVVAPAVSERGRIDLPLSKDPSRVGRYRALRGAHGVPALTEYVRLGQGPDHAVLELHPKTGRTHQLRAHLTALGFPIAGDRLYGGPTRLGERTAERCLLHAYRIDLPHPSTGSPLEIESPIPTDLAPFVKSAGSLG